MTGVHQEVLILHRLMAVHSSPVLEVTLFYSGWQLCRYSPQGGHGNLLRSNVPGLHVYLWNTGDRALSILNAVLIKFSSWQHYDHYDLCCNLYNDLTFWSASASSVPDVKTHLEQGWGVWLFSNFQKKEQLALLSVPHHLSYQKASMHQVPPLNQL